jgi:hypothetical protein
MKSASSFRVIALTESFAREVRSTMKSPGYGHPVHAEVESDHWPCRVCLERKEPTDERRLLFTLDAFRGVEELPLPGPVFIHERECTRFPEDGGFPDDLRRVPLTLNAYGKGRQLRAQEAVTNGEVEPAIAALLARDDVDYIHLRHRAAGCYLARIERAG